MTTLDKPCRVWAGAKHGGGYGCRRVNGKTKSVHRLEWEKHHGPIPDGLYVCHHCDNRACYEIEHLFMGTRSDNMRDMARKGRSTHGERGAMAKLTADQVAKVRRRLDGGESQQAIARDYGVSQSLISLIKTGRRWSRASQRQGQ